MPGLVGRFEQLVRAFVLAQSLVRPTHPQQGHAPVVPGDADLRVGRAELLGKNTLRRVE